MFRLSCHVLSHQLVSKTGEKRSLMTPLVNGSVSPGAFFNPCRCLNHDVWQTTVGALD